MTNKIRLTVIIPSRKQEKQLEFIERAVKSVRGQSIASNFEIIFLVGLDKKCHLDADFQARLNVTCVESQKYSQAAALNAGIRKVQGGYVAFLEDDDEWLPDYLEVAMQAIKHCDFVSSTQVEFNENDVLIRINDFPTPSGWLMPSSTLELIGEFNEEYQFHLDNEWLGRLSEAKLKRIHMVESTAPVDLAHIQQVRPWLANVLAAGFCITGRHQSPYPLVKRLIHSQSGMAQIASREDLQKISKEEQGRLVNRFGKIPW